jgi:hypothetical protein
LHGGGSCRQKQEGQGDVACDFMHSALVLS